jgi:hypothetical protein
MILIAVKIDTYIHTSMMAKLIPMILLKTKSLDKKTTTKTRRMTRHHLGAPSHRNQNMTFRVICPNKEFFRNIMKRTNFSF